MNSSRIWQNISTTALRRIAGGVCCGLLAFATPAPASLLPGLPSLSVKAVSVTGSATNTITSLEFINDVTLAIEAIQVGHLTHFGNFTGEFSYLAVATPLTITLTGSATLTNDQGEKLFVTAALVELGADYPKAVTGTLVVTGGTGRFAGATGAIAVSGTDEESLTDTFKLNGALATVAAL